MSGIEECTLRTRLTHGLKGAWFQIVKTRNYVIKIWFQIVKTRNYVIKIWFQVCLSKLNLHHYNAWFIRAVYVYARGSSYDSQTLVVRRLKNKTGE